MSRLIKLIILSSVMAALGTALAECVLAETGQANARIVLPATPSPVVAYAASDLQHFLEEMSGARLEVVSEAEAGGGPAILIGWSERVERLVPRADVEALAEDGVLLRTVGDDLVLLGRNDRGQLYSVYVLLERYLGVRFLARDCTVVPKRDRVVLPEIDYAYAPPLMYRETLYFDSFPREIAARQRLNGPTTECDAEVGGKIAFYPYVHSFCKLIPPEEFFDEHPEYFSLVNGERTHGHIHSQLCLTNPDVLRIATERVLQWIDEHPEVPIFDVSQNDGGGACECEACAAVVAEEGSQHGPILRFVNAIADAVAEGHPDKWVETLAYSYSTKPPAVTKPRDNVIIRLCHAGCYYHGFEACGLGANLAAYIDEWSKLTQRIFIWHYATNFAHYLAPNPNLEGLAKDIRYYAAHGVNGLMAQGDYQSPGGELAELRQYLATQLMWDPSRDPLEVRREFCEGYYGPASDDVLAYLSLLDEAGRRPDVHAFGAWDPQGTVPPELVDQALGILTQARGKADTPATANHVDKLFLPWWYMQLAFPEKYPCGEPAEVLDAFRTVVEANAVTHVSEGPEPNIEPWLAEMATRFAPLPEGVVYDLHRSRGEAVVENCMDWRTDSVEVDGERVASLFQHPPAEGHGAATFTITLPEGEKLVFQFATAFTGPTANGARFTVLIDGAEVWSHTQTDTAPVPHGIDLSPYAGAEIKLTLRIDGLGDTTHDWANWVQPRVVRGKTSSN